MGARSRKMSVLLGVAATAGLGGLANEVKAASYTVSNSFTLPTGSNFFLASDVGPTPGYMVNYNVSSVGSVAINPALPNGGSFGILGTLTGTGANTSGGTTNNSTGTDTTAFAYDSFGFRLVGVYTYNSANLHTSNVTVQNENSAGQVLGHSPINSNFNSSSNGLLGQIAWVTNANGSSATLGLTGSNFGYTQPVDAGTDTGTHSSSLGSYINANGLVDGNTSRYAGNSYTTATQGLGQSAWVYIPNTANSLSGNTYEVGLTGVGDSYNVSATQTAAAGAATVTLTGYLNTPGAMSLNGEVTGSATAYTSLGTTISSSSDAWVYSGGPSGTNTSIGAFNFTPTSGTNFSTTTTTFSANNSAGTTTYTETLPSPIIAAASGTYMNGTSGTPSIFTYGFIYKLATYGSPSDPVSQIAGRSSSVTAINASGTIGLTSAYYINNSSNPSGTDSFVYRPGAASPYTQVGLTASNFPANNLSGGAITPYLVSFVSQTGARSSNIKFLNAANQSSGTSAAYISNATGTAISQGLQAAWFANANGATTQIGLFNASLGLHTDPNGFFSESVTNMTNSGLVAGYSSRYNGSSTSSNGQDAWVYDSKLGKTIPVDPNDDSNIGVPTYSIINYLSENGYAVGQYEMGAASGNATYPLRGFIWSEAYGIQDLDVSIPYGLPSTAYQNIINTYNDDLNGNNIYATASTTGLNTTVGALVTLNGSPVPEPATLSIFGIGAVGLLARRRRRI